MNFNEEQLSENGGVETALMSVQILQDLYVLNTWVLHLLQGNTLIPILRCFSQYQIRPLFPLSDTFDSIVAQL